jgi:hypothetical protein
VLFARRGVICFGKYPDIGGKAVVTHALKPAHQSRLRHPDSEMDFRLDHEGNLVPPVD